MIIGITGGSGCGKTTALNVIRELGGVVLDCDRIYHQLLETDEEMLRAIASRFPGTVKDGVLLRKELGSVVFSDPDALLALNGITHSAVKREVLRQLESAPRLAAIDAIALFESGLSRLCQLTVAVTAPIEDRVTRLMARDGISRDYALSRIAAQPSDAEFSRLCQHTLVNDTTPQDFHRKCLAFFQSCIIMEETM